MTCDCFFSLTVLWNINKSEFFNPSRVLFRDTVYINIVLSNKMQPKQASFSFVSSGRTDQSILISPRPLSSSRNQWSEKVYSLSRLYYKFGQLHNPLRLSICHVQLERCPPASVTAPFAWQASCQEHLSAFRPCLMNSNTFCTFLYNFILFKLSS